MENDKWWSQFGEFPLENIWVVTARGKRARFPDPLTVTRHYMKLKGCTTKKLAEEIGVTYSTVRHYLAYGVRFDQYSFRRALCIVLDIPPLLFGLDEQAVQEALADEVLGQLVYNYRNQRRWTQYQLGQALDPCLCEASIALTEKGKGLDSMKRRRALSFILSIPPVLLGLAEPSTVAPTSKIMFPKTAVSLSGALPEYRNVQAQIFDSYYRGMGKDRILDVASQLQTLQQALTVANGDCQRLEIIGIQEIYHAFYVWQGKEDCNYKTALAHANKWIDLAASTLDETTWRSRERLAIAYLHRSEVWREYGEIGKAIQDVDKAVYYANGTSNLVMCRAYVEAGTVHALAREQGKGKAYGESLLERAGSMFPLKEEENHYYLRLNRGFFYLRRAMALQSEEAIKDARVADTGSVTRRTLILDIEEANMHLRQGEHEKAAQLAVQSLDTARSIRSNLNIIRVGNLYEGLKGHMDIPEVARLSLFYLSQ